MHRILCLLAAVLMAQVVPALAQPAPPPPGDFQNRLQRIVAPGMVPGQPNIPELTRFSLDFPGGSPSDLVKAIEKAMGPPMNVIINPEDENVRIPPLKMYDVSAPQLFAALAATSRKVVEVSSLRFGDPYGNSYSQQNTGYAFQTADSPLTDSSIWYFHVDKPSLPPVMSTQKVCQFYSLSEYLNRGFTVDDITTAIQTGWKLAGDTETPELKYHKETKLLIAYGAPEQLLTIDHVLKTLPSESGTRTRMETDQIVAQIKDLQKEVEQLKQSAPSGAPIVLPEEKSGK